MPAVKWSGTGSGGSSVTTGTLTTMSATTGTSGQSFYNSTYNAYFDWIVDRWWPRQPDPRYGFFVFDEFLGTDRVGTLDWITNAGTINFAVATATNPGILTIAQLTASALGNLRLNQANVQLGTMDVYFECILAIPTLATISEDFCVTVGLNDGIAFSSTGVAVDGVYFQINRGVNGAKWILNTSSNSTVTTQNTTSADIVAGTYYRVGCYIAAGASVQFFLNGATLGTAITTNIPSGASRQTGLQIKLDKIAGTTTGTVNVDYIALWGFYNGQRVA